MKLTHEFIQLPVLFDVASLQKEVKQLGSDLWKSHHEGFKGNFSIPLISVGGQYNNEFNGAMATTDVLRQSRYLTKTIASFGEVIGRSRLMGLSPGAEVPLHSDINYHWYKRVRIHIPIITAPEVVFYCGDKSINMQPGEAWIFDSWKYHRVVNGSDIFRVHLVIDISGSSRFWKMTQRGNVPGREPITPVEQFYRVNPGGEESLRIETEQFNAPLVMAPGEMEGIARELLDELAGVSGNERKQIEEFGAEVKSFCQDWRVLWSQYGMSEAGFRHYHELRSQAFEKVRKFDSTLMLANGTQAPRMFLHCMVDPALNVGVKDSYLHPKPLAAPQQTTGNETSINNLVPASRNAPCPCGSQKRYKNCHGKLD